MAKDEPQEKIDFHPHSLDQNFMGDIIQWVTCISELEKFGFVTKNKKNFGPTLSAI